jgi:prepilin-type N-terminal cleavage/methylation domain-containing protein
VAAERFIRTVRVGLTLFEVIVSLAIIAILAAVAFQNLAGHSDRMRVAQSVSALQAARLSIYRFDSAVGRFPLTIQQLHTKITGSDVNSCGTTYSTKGAGAEVTAWENNARGGPFREYPSAVTGFPIGVGVVSDTFIREPATAANTDRSFGLLQVVVRRVTDEDAAELNLIVDGDGSATNGAVRWVADGSGTNTMTWNIPIAGC